jgi:hypothetical protein
MMLGFDVVLAAGSGHVTHLTHQPRMILWLPSALDAVCVRPWRVY